MNQHITTKGETIAAFTLIELIVAAVIMVILVLIMVAGFTQNYSILQTNKVLNNFQNDARLAILKMDNDLRRTDLSQITINTNTPLAGCDTLIYHLPSLDANNTPLVSNGALQWNTNTVTIAIDTGNAGHLIRTDTNGVTLLANNINTITFRDIHNLPQLCLSELKIALGFRATSFGNRTLTYNSTAVINMRN